MLSADSCRELFPEASGGFVSGMGLVLVATFPIAYAVLVDPVIFQVPVPQPFPEAPDSMANGIIHIVLMLGSFMGVLTFPIWSALIGRKLLQQGRVSPEQLAH